MASIDQLQIEIQASSTDAKNAIDNLVKSLKELNSQLGLKDGTSFARTLNSMARAMENFTGKMNGFSSNKFDKAAQGAKDTASATAEATKAVESLQQATEAASKGFETISKYANNEKIEVVPTGTYGAIKDFFDVQERGWQSNIEKMSAAESLAQSFRDSFSEFRTPEIDAFYGRSEQAIDTTATEVSEKLLPAVVDTESAIKQMFSDMISQSSSAETAIDPLISKLMEYKELVKSPFTFADPYTDKQGNYHSADVTAWQAVMDKTSGSDYFYQTAEAANAAADSIKKVTTTALALPEQFKTSTEYIKECLESEKKGSSDAGKAAAAASSEIAQSFKKPISAIETAIKKVNEYKKAIRDMESGGSFDVQKYDEAVKGLDEATKAVENYKKALLGIKDESKTKIHEGADRDVITNLAELSDALEKVSERFNMVAEKGIAMFKFLTTPMRKVAEEYGEKFRNMTDHVVNFRKNFQVHMKKVSDFWKRTMRTFTFMLVRKAITAIIKEVNNAIQSMAMFSNAMGTEFNNSISLLVADFQYLGRSIVSVFAPLLNYIAPIIDAIVDKIALLLSYIGMLMAALTGASSFTKAKKNVTNYAESLDSASKSAKNLTMGIDELNILSENSGGGSSKPYDGWEDAWEEVDIPSWIRDIADWLKDFWNRFFAPLLEAWNRAKQYLIDGFKTMLDALGRMFGHIIDDFLTMWNQEKTIRMFEMMLRIVGDLMRVIRNLADQFDKAWQKGKVGLKIFENLRDIAAILVDHVRNVSYYMIDWANGIDFSPVLEAFEELTRKLKRPADFIGGIFEDIMKNGVLKYIEFMIEDAVPHLLETIAKISDAFHFETLREKLKPVWSAIEEVLENIHTGITNALGNLGVEIARFTGSKEFEDFLQRLVDISKEITSARVEKILTGIGEGILAIIKAIVKFINSDGFLKFIKAIGEWIDKKSTKDIADILEKIAFAIAGFKFASFATNKLAGFFKFFTVIVAMKNLKDVASGLLGVEKGVKGVSTAASGFTKVVNPLSKFKTLLADIGIGIKSIPSKIAEIGTKLAGLSATLSPLVSVVGSLVAGFLEFKLVSDSITNLLTGTENLVGNIVKLTGAVVAAGVAFTALLGFPAGIIAAGVVAAIAAIKGITDAVEQINFDHMLDAVMTKGDTTVQQVGEWYSQTTSIISENTQKWIDIERNLTQDRTDIEQYAKSLEGLSAAMDSNTQLTVSSADQLTGKYEDLSNAINNYINQSTDAIVQNILAQRAFLEAQGVDVDTMIANIYKGIDEEQKAITEATEGVRKAFEAYQQAVDEHGDDSSEAIAKWDLYVEAVEKAGTTLEKWTSKVQDIDTSSAVEEITKLGDSLDLSQYTNDAEGLEQAKNDIANTVEAIRLKYEEELGKVNQTAEDKVNELNTFMNEHPGLIDEATKTKILNGIQKDADNAKEVLATSAGQALDLFSNDLTQKFADVAQKASDDYDKMPWYEKLFQPGKDQYVLNQMQSYADSVLTGEEGLNGILSNAYKQIYEDLPGKTAPDVEAAMKGILENEATFFITSASGKQELLAKNNGEMLQAVLNAVDGVDYDTPANIYADKSYNAYQKSLEGIDYISLGRMWNAETGNAILNNTQLLEDSNRLAANDGAAAFSQEYVDFLTDNQDIINTMETTGNTYGGGLIEGLNQGVEENMSTTEPVLYQWFKNISDWIHNNPYAKFGSPNIKTQEYGTDLVTGLNIGINNSRSTTKPAIDMWFAVIKGAIVNQLREVKNLFNESFSEIFTGKGVDVEGSTSNLFTQLKAVVQKNFDALGSDLIGNVLPTFMQTYILPFFNVEMWQPLFDNLLNVVFIPAFELFKMWFDEAMLVWWEEHMLTWFTVERWDEDIFTPLAENIHEHFATFSDWWDATMLAWWTNQVEPWFEQEKWTGLFNHILDAVKEVFKKIVEEIRERIQEAVEVVVEACETMADSLQTVLDLIDEIMTSLKEGFGDFSGTVSFDFGGSFASGGFPSYGSLFVAGEPGAGAEFVGNIHGRTGVVSNGEITGIEDAVYATGNAETELLSQLISISRAMLDKDPVVITDKDIARLNNSGQGKLGMSIIS